MIGWQIKMFPTVTDNDPPEDGTYAVEVYFGWKLLDWKDGEWWHPGCVGRWGVDEPLQWVGPLPARRKQKQEFDL